ncbi:MAG: hypothetical protein ACMUHY_04880 [Thermoplasmatota archaeon]
MDGKCSKVLLLLIMGSLLVPGSWFIRMEGSGSPTMAEDSVESGNEPEVRSLRFLSDHFVANEGQWDHDLSFVGRTRFGHVGFREGEVVFNMIDTEDDLQRSVRLGLKGGYPSSPRGEHALEFRSNFFKGEDPSMWRSGVENFREVIYDNIWDGIDLRFRYMDGSLKYDLILGPGSDPGNIHFEVSGADIDVGRSEVKFSPGGTGTLQDCDLEAWYDDGGEGIECDFRSVGSNGYGFSIGDYDDTRTVIIDPLVYSSFFGGINMDEGKDLMIDDSDCLFITGRTRSYDFPVTTGAYDTSWNGDSDIFVVKVNSKWTSAVYCTYVGSTYIDHCGGIDIDSLGCAYVAGGTGYSGFPTTPGAYKTSREARDGFIFKLNPQGSALLYSSFVGGTGYEYAYDVDVDANGSAYVLGYTNSNYYTEGAYHVRGYDDDIFLLKMNRNGSALDFCALIGGNDEEWPWSVEIGPDNNIYAVGRTRSDDLPTTPDAFDSVPNGDDGFLVVLSPDGASLNYSTYIGGSQGEWAFDLTFNEDGEVLITGISSSSDFPKTDWAPNITNKGGSDVFITRLDANRSIVRSNLIGGSGTDRGNGIICDGHGTVYVCGYTYSDDFLVTPGTYDPTFNQGGYGTDAFLTRLDSKTLEVLNSTYIGGTHTDEAQGIEMDSNDLPVMVGVTVSSDYPNTGTGLSNNKDNDYSITITQLTLEIISYPPRNLSYDWSADGVTLSWKEPSYDGGTRAVRYDIYRKFGDDPYEPIRKGLVSRSYLDRTVKRGEGYHYRITAVNSVGASPWSNEVFAIDLEPPVFKSDVSSENASTGDPFDLTVKVVDNVEVRSVHAEYWTDLMGPFNLSMTRGAEDGWHAGIIVPDNTGDLRYRFVAFDPTNNSMSSGTVSVPIEDNDAPLISMIKDLENLTTGDGYEVQAQVTDNIEVDEVHFEYWLGAGEEHSNVTMDSVFNIYSFGSTVTDSIEDFYWRISASDSSGNWGVIEGTSVIKDNDLPVMVDLQESGAVTTGDPFNITLEVSDNIAIRSIRLEYWFDDEEHVTEEWGNSVITELSIIVPGAGFTRLSYIVHLEDTSGNTISTPAKMLEILDNDPPIIEYDRPPYEIGTGDTLFLNGTVRDNFELNNFRIEYWIDDENPIIDNIAPVNGRFEFSMDVPMDRTGTLHLLLEASDISGNDNASVIHEVSIIDVIDPTIRPISDITLYVGEVLRIDAVIEDNVGIRSISWIGLPGGTNSSSFSSTMEEAGEHRVSLYVQDLGWNSISVDFNVLVLSADHDSDRDGIPDTYERRYGLDMNDPVDGSMDLDSDGLSNLLEFQRGTNMSDPDSDGDGMPDGWEVGFGLDPLTPSADEDTDRDGTPDLEEYQKGSDPTVDETEDDGGGLWMILLIIMIVLVVAGTLGALSFLMVRKKRSSGSVDEKEGEEDGTVKGPEKVEPKTAGNPPVRPPGPMAPSQAATDLVNRLKELNKNQNLREGGSGTGSNLPAQQTQKDAGQKQS